MISGTLLFILQFGPNSGSALPTAWDMLEALGKALYKGRLQNSSTSRNKQ